jgi:hypothetical protein
MLAKIQQNYSVLVLAYKYYSVDDKNFKICKYNEDDLLFILQILKHKTSQRSYLLDVKVLTLDGRVGWILVAKKDIKQIC